jgi:hypothetical protein
VTPFGPHDWALTCDGSVSLGLRTDDRRPDSFIPFKLAPAYLQPDNIIGEPVHGIEVMGSYGPAWLIETPFVPQDYVAVVASGGLNAQSNVVGVREHPVASYRGQYHPIPSP